MTDESLRALPARRIIAHIADAAERWRNADFPVRVRATAAIEERLGYSLPMVEYALDRLFFGVTAQALEAAIVSELGSVAALDGIEPRRNAPAAWARGVDRTVIVSSDTTIGVALVPAIFALCAKSSVVVKDRSDALLAAFFATLAEEHPAFALAATASAWVGGADPGEAELLAHAEIVIAFGGDEALLAIRARCGVETRFVPFGRRASAGYLSARGVDQLDDTRADALVRDAVLYDGEGCLSLHVLFVEVADERLASVTAALRCACERMAVEFPVGRRTAGQDSRAASFRSLERFRSAVRTGSIAHGESVSTQSRVATVVVARSHDEPPPFVAGVLFVVPVVDEDAAAAYVLDHRLPVQALGVDQVDDAAIALAQRIGAVRACVFGTMQDPPVAGHHGGEGRIAPFVRWIDAQ